MQASAEISQKVRLAIKTKLTELGAYVDDELPDYVLVMVANRRGRNDMKKELELFLGDATERFCTWLFGVLDKLKDAKKGREKGDDGEPEAKNEPADDRAELDSYSESEPDEPKKDEKIKKDKPAENDIKQPKVDKEKSLPKARKTRSRSKSPALRMDRKSPAPLRMDRQTSRAETRRRAKSRSRSRSPDRRRRSRSRDRRRKSRSISRDRKDKRREKKVVKAKKDKKEKKTRHRSESPEKESRTRKDSEKVAENDVEKRTRLSRRIKAAGGLKSTVALQKEPELDEAEKQELESRKTRGEKEKPIKAVKPTSSLIIRATNDSALSITRSITVKSTGTKKNKDKTPDSDAKKEKTGSKRKSKGKEESDPEIKLRKVKNGGTDQRVFVTKTDDDDKKVKKKKSEKTGKKGRAVSPKFFVTLDGEKKEKEAKIVTGKAASPAKQTDHLIIHPNITSDDSDDESSKNIFPTRNTTAQEEAAKIKELQAQNPLPSIESGMQQSVTLDLTSIKKDDPDTRTIFVSGLDWRVTEKELKEHFEVCGTIVRVTVLKDRTTHFSKGCAYIQFSTMEQRTTACAFDKTEVYGRTIRVSEKLSAQAQMYPPTTFDTEPVGYTAPRAYDPQYTFRKNAATGKSQYSWTRNGYMPPR